MLKHNRLLLRGLFSLCTLVLLSLVSVSKAVMRSDAPKYIGIIAPRQGDGLPYAFIPIDLRQAMESSGLVTKDRLQVILLDTPSAIDSALTTRASEYLAIINPLGEFFIAKDQSDVTPMLSRIKSYVKQGGSWWATGGYPFFYAAWRGGGEVATNGWNREVYGDKGLASFGMELNVVPNSEPSLLKLTNLGAEILGNKWARYINNERADAVRFPDWKTAGAVLVQTEDRPYVTAHRIGKGLMWHITGFSNSASVLVPCIIGSCEYIFNHSLPDWWFANHNGIAHGNVKRTVAKGKTHSIIEIPNLEYARVGSTSLKLDLYLPKNAMVRVPVILWVHGGGWEAGDRKNPPGLDLVRKGYALASVEYRLSRQATFPAQLFDLKGAIRWLRAHARQYGLDPERFGAWGHSAGGHLVALLGTTGRVKSLEGSEGGNLEYSSVVQCISDWAGPTDFLTDPSEIGPNSAASKLIGATVDTNLRLAKYASPVTYVSASDPPFLIVHGEMDRLVPVGQAKELYEALKRAGVSVTLMLRPFTDHGIHDPMVTWTQERFFNRYLKSGKVRN